MFSWQRECTISTSSHARNNDYCSLEVIFKIEEMLPIFQKCLTLAGIFRTLRKDFRQIYWKCCDRWEKNVVFKTLTDQIEQQCQSPEFTLRPQAVSALTTTLCAYAMLLEDLLNEAYHQSVITARLQNGPVEDVFSSTG